MLKVEFKVPVGNKKDFQGNLESLYLLMVGTARFELATTCPPDKCATRLRYAPIAIKNKASITILRKKCQDILLYKDDARFYL